MFENPWWRVFQDEVEFPGGREGLHMRMEPTSGKPGVVALIIRETGSEAEIALVSQWRYAQSRQSWELPRGFGESDDATPLESAAREIAEETGLTVSSIEKIGEIVTDSSIIAGRVFVYLVKTDGEGIEQSSETDGFHWVSIQELSRACRDGDVVDSFTASALGLAACRDDVRGRLWPE